MHPLKSLLLGSVLLALCLHVCTWAVELQEQAAAVVAAYEQGMNQKSVEQVFDQIHPEHEELPRNVLEQALQQDFNANPNKTMSLQLDEVMAQEDMARAWVTTTTNLEDSPSGVRELFLFKEYEGDLKIAGIYQELDANVYDPQTRILASTKGQYQLTLPEGWFALGSSGFLKSVSSDSVIILAPDLKSRVMLGLIQLPLKLADTEVETARQAVMGDVAAAQRFTQDHEILSEGSVQVAGLEGYQVISSFSVEDRMVYQRKRVYLSESPLLYFFVCDAIGAGKYEVLEPSFASLLNSFSLMEPEEGMSRQEVLAAEHASGAVAGRVYTSDEYNCFIAAPEGWEMRTSPNPAHLVEMQYQTGKSLCRLIATRGLSEDMTAQQMFDTRLDSVRPLVQDFKELSQTQVTIQRVPGVQSIQTFFVEGFGGFHVKEVTLVKDGIYYLILCQCIDPDDYAILEKDFDQVINSFGFIQ